MMLLSFLICITLSYYIRSISTSTQGLHQNEDINNNMMFDNDNILRRRSCCEYKNSPTELYHCTLHQSNNKILQLSHKDLIIFVTYATESILSYSSYSIAMNAFYCNLYNYQFHIVSSTDHIEYSTSLDPRWNKIHILKESLLTWGSKAKYIIWLDSDLSIINYHLDIKDLIHKYNYADMIMSKDIDTAPFVSNSGTIIIKNTNWTNNILELWWNSYDRIKCCDQNAFTWLYDRNIPTDIRSKVALLPVDTINTNFPAWKNQHENNSILHLAGLTSLYRIPVFYHGFEVLCDHIDKYITMNIQDRNVNGATIFMNALPHQLGLTKDFLFQSMRQLNQLRNHTLDLLFNKLPHTLKTSTSIGSNTTTNNSQQLNYSFRYIPNDNRIYLIISEDLIQKYRKELEDVMKFDDDEKQYFQDIDIIILRNKELKIREWIFWQLYDLTKNKLNNSKDTNTNNRKNNNKSDNKNKSDHIKHDIYLYETAKETCSTGFEFVIAMKLHYIAIHSNHQIDNETNDNDILSKTIFTSHCQYILKHVIDLIEIVLEHSINDHLPTMLKGLFHYYLFKSYQLLAGSYQLGSMISYNQYDSIKWLTLASKEWQNMVEHNYYSSNYVLADPEKEYSTVLSELAMLYCLTNQFYKGLVTYNTSIHLQHHTIEGYSLIRIATEDVIQSARIILVETYINAGICCIESRNETFINDAKYFFHQGIDIMKAYMIINEKLSNIIEEYNTKLSSAIDNTNIIKPKNNIIQEIAQPSSILDKENQQFSNRINDNIIVEHNIKVDNNIMNNQSEKVKLVKIVKKKMKRKSLV